MRRSGWVVVALALMAGCADAPPPRFVAGRPMILGSSENEAIAARLNLYARVHSEGIAACFDDLALRTDSDALMEAALYLTTRDVGSVLTDVRPENEDTVVDTELRSCLSRQVASWRITRGDASVRIELKVNPRRTQLTPESSQ